MKNPCIGCKKSWSAGRYCHCYNDCDDLKIYLYDNNTNVNINIVDKDTLISALNIIVDKCPFNIFDDVGFESCKYNLNMFDNDFCINCWFDYLKIKS
jgi:hypothetical protein